MLLVVFAPEGRHGVAWDVSPRGRSISPLPEPRRGDMLGRAPCRPSGAQEEEERLPNLGLTPQAKSCRPSGAKRKKTTAVILGLTPQAIPCRPSGALEEDRRPSVLKL